MFDEQLQSQSSFYLWAVSISASTTVLAGKSLKWAPSTGGKLLNYSGRQTS